VHATLAGIDADIVDDHGDTVKRADAGGYLVIKKPWPSMLAHHLAQQRALHRRLLGEIQQSPVRGGRQRPPR